MIDLIYREAEEQTLPERNRRCLLVLYDIFEDKLWMDHLVYGKLCDDGHWNIWNELYIKPEWSNCQTQLSDRYIVAYWTYFDMDTHRSTYYYR